MTSAPSRHPLSAPLTRAAEAAGALRALLLAAGDERVPAVDRVALVRLWTRLRAELGAVPWSSATVRATVGRLTAAMAHDDDPDDMLSE